MLCCCHVPMKPGCSALGGLVLNCMELSPAPSAPLLTMLKPPRTLLILLLGPQEGEPAVPVARFPRAAGDVDESGWSLLGSGGTALLSLPLTSNSASLDLDRKRERVWGRARGWRSEGGEKEHKSAKVGSVGSC